MTAVVLFAHGSPVAEANDGVAALARTVSERIEADFVLTAFLDPAKPNLGDAIAEAVDRGATRIAVMPYFLTIGLHLRRDLPVLIEEQRRRFPNVKILVTESLEGHPGMAEAVAARVRETLER